MLRKTPMRAFLDSIPLGKEHLLASFLELKVGRYNPLEKNLAPW